MLEPVSSKQTLVPDVALIPLLAYDSRNYRLGYGGGYYDKFLNKYLKKNKNILTIGVAFSFQKYKKASNIKVRCANAVHFNREGIKKNMKILTLGDIFGEPGRTALTSKLPELIKKEIEFVIVNGENAADPGVGITKKMLKIFLKQE